MGGVGGREEEWKPSEEVSSGSQPGRTRTLQTSQRLSSPLRHASNIKRIQLPSEFGAEQTRQTLRPPSGGQCTCTQQVTFLTKPKIRRSVSCLSTSRRRPKSKNIQRFHERTVPLIQSAGRVGNCDTFRRPATPRHTNPMLND